MCIPTKCSTKFQHQLTTDSLTINHLVDKWSTNQRWRTYFNLIFQIVIFFENIANYNVLIDIVINVKLHITPFAEANYRAHQRQMHGHRVNES